MANARVIYHPYGVEVWSGDEFAGGITHRRLVDGPEAVAEAVRCILESFGIVADVEDARLALERRTLPSAPTKR